MEKITISTDSTADLSKDLIEKNNITIAPLHVLLGENDHKDGIDIMPEDIFNYVKENNELPKTSACSVAEYIEIFTKLLNDNDYVIHFTISSKCSSTYNNAVLAANEFDGKVKIIDSLHLSTGQGLLVLKACDMVKEGKSFNEIVSNVEELKNKVQTSFVVDTVDYLYKGGRCTAAARIASKILNIHPSITMKNGTLGVKKNYHGNLKKSLEGYSHDLALEYKSYDKKRVFITHSCCSDEIVNSVIDIVKKEFNFEEIIVTVAGSVVTSHCGQGTLGILFITE